MTRNGKIARLPREIRDRLNARLQNGEPGIKLVAWLNSLPDVQEVLEAWFNDRPITEQNLSEWKQGGYQDWLKHQESLEWMRTVSEEAEELNEQAGLVPVSDRVSSMVGLLLGQMIRSYLKDGLPAKSEQRRELLELMREFSRHRKGDHRAASLKVELELRDETKIRQHRIQEAREKNREENANWHAFIKAMGREEAMRNWTKGMTLEKENELRSFLGMPRSTKLQGAEPADETQNPTESDSIRPDPTSFSAAA